MAKQSIPTRAERVANLSGILEGINKQYKGAAVIQGVDELTAPWVSLRRPTGITSLDIALKGGAPAGGIIRWWGERSAGKDLVYWNAVREQQRIYGNDCCLALAITDTGLDKTQGRLLGASVPFSNDEIKEMERARGVGFSAEELKTLKFCIGYFQNITAESGEKLLDVVLDLARLNIYSLIGVNSVGSITTEGEIEAESLGDNQQLGRGAALVTKFLKPLNHILINKDEHGRPNTTTVWLVDQVRSKMNATKYEDPFKPTSGNAIEHYIMADVRIRSGSKIKNADNEVIGKAISCTILKQKSGGHEGEKVEFNYFHDTGPFGAGVDFAQDVLDLGVKYGLITKNGSWYQMGDKKLQGAAATEMLRADPLLYQQSRDAVLEAAGIRMNYKEQW